MFKVLLSTCMLFLSLSSFAYDEEYDYQYVYLRLAPLCYAIGPQMKVDGDQVYMTFLKECLTHPERYEKRILPKSKFEVEGNHVFFKGIDCGEISDEGVVKLGLSHGDYNGNCIKTNTTNIGFNKFMLRAKQL